MQVNQPSRQERVRALGQAMLEFRKVLKNLEVPVEQESTMKYEGEALRELGEKRQAEHDLFLDQGWQLAEWAPLRSWQGFEAEIVALNALGRRLGQSHGELLGVCGDKPQVGLSGGWEKAVREYQELGKRLEEGVKFSCPWPQLREVLGEQKTQPANLLPEGGLSPN